MDKRSFSVLILVSAFSFFLITNSAWAGSAQHNRWKGFAIGVGVAILGNAILNHHKQLSYSKPDNCTPPFRRRPVHRHYMHRGHWETRSEWIPPTYKRVWNPGHYNHHGFWIEGQWIELVDQPSYWIEKRVWVVSEFGTKRRYK